MGAIQRLREELLAGSATEALRLLGSLDADFAAKRPHAMFQLRLLRFAELLEAGDTDAALAFVRGELCPLADACADLMPDLKATLVALAGSPPTSVYCLICLARALTCPLHCSALPATKHHVRGRCACAVGSGPPAGEPRGGSQRGAQRALG